MKGAYSDLFLVAVGLNGMAEINDAGNVQLNRVTMQQLLLTSAVSPLSWCSLGANVIAEAGRGYDHTLSGYSFSVGPDTTESAVF